MTKESTEMTEEKDTPPSGVEISKKLVLINSASSLVVLGLNVTVIVWLQHFLLNKISLEEYSMLPVLYSVIMLAPLLTIIFTQGPARYATEAYAEGNTQRVTQISSTMFLILLGVGCLTLTIGLVITYFLGDLLTLPPEHLGEAKLMLVLLILSFSLKVIMTPFCVGLEIRQKFVVSNLVGTGGQFLRLTILFGLLFGVSVKVLWVVVATVSAEITTQLVILTLSLRAVPSLRFRRDAINWPIARQLYPSGDGHRFQLLQSQYIQALMQSY